MLILWLNGFVASIAVSNLPSVFHCFLFNCPLCANNNKYIPQLPTHRSLSWPSFAYSKNYTPALTQTARSNLWFEPRGTGNRRGEARTVALSATPPIKVTYLATESYLCLLVHKALIGHTPDYITDMLTPVASIPTRSSLRASSNGDLHLPRTERWIGDRPFSPLCSR